MRPEDRVNAFKDCLVLLLALCQALLYAASKVLVKVSVCYGLLVREVWDVDELACAVPCLHEVGETLSEG